MTTSVNEYGFGVLSAILFPDDVCRMLSCTRYPCSCQVCPDVIESVNYHSATANTERAIDFFNSPERL